MFQLKTDGQSLDTSQVHIHQPNLNLMALSTNEYKPLSRTAKVVCVTQLLSVKIFWRGHRCRAYGVMRTDKIYNDATQKALSEEPISEISLRRRQMNPFKDTLRPDTQEKRSGKDITRWDHSWAG